MTTAEANIPATEISAYELAAQKQQQKKPARGLTQRAYLNAFSSFIDYGAKVATVSIVTPLVVAGLGNSMFGVWQMLSRLVTYMQAADGRPTQALKWVIANRQADADFDAKRRQIGSALGVWVMFLPVILGLGVVMVWMAPVVTKVPAEMYLTVRFTCALLVLNFLLTNLVALPESVLRGMNLGYKRMGLQASLNILGGALTFGALYMGWGLKGLASAQVALTLLTGAMFWLVVKKYVPWFGIARSSLKEVRAFLKVSIWWFAWTLINRLLLASDILILGFVASTSAVTVYALTSFAGQTLLSIVTMLIGAVTPGLGGVIGEKKFEKASALRREMRTVSWLLLTAIGSTILLWNRSFISLWVGEERFAGFWPNLLIVLMVAQFVFIRNDAHLIDLTLQLKEKVLMGAIAAVLSIGLSALLIPRLGIVGLCLGMISGRMVLTVSYPFIINSFLGRPADRRLGEALRRALTTLSIYGASGYLGRLWLADNWLVWAACVGVSFAVSLGVASMAGLSTEMRRSLFLRLSMIRGLRASRGV
ncbi:MAG TPA: oligosaccharide flippase family protein [Pyrinomonadaceae bacterium]|jgi:O-antigen/teichoic acid export membrane protein